MSARSHSILAGAAEAGAVEIPAPAADWTPEQQIAHMLDLCEAQIEAALSESDLAVDALVRSFTTLAETTRSMSARVAELPAQAASAPEGPGPEAAGCERTGLAGRFDEQLGSMSKEIASAVVAFQFYDKLTQRLGHVRYSLSTLALFVCDRSQASERDHWRKLFTTLRRLYRTEEERQIFQLMVEGASAEDARSQAQQTTQSLRREPAGDIELF